MEFPLCMCRRGSGSSDLQLWKKKQNRALQGGNPASCCPWGHLANTDRGEEPMLAGSSTGHRRCCVLLAPSAYTGSSLVSGTCSEENEILKISAYRFKKPISSLLPERDSFRSHWCWERFSLSEGKGDYKSSGSQQRCSVPRRLVCWLISPKHVFGELWGQQNTICRARSLIRSRSGTRLLPGSCHVRHRQAGVRDVL